MNRNSLAQIYDRLTGLIDKLPGGLQKPILRELNPIRQIFLEQRPARILLLGEAAESVPEFLASLGCKQVVTGGSENGWRTYRVAGLGEVQILDGRGDVPAAHVEAGLRDTTADLALLLAGESNHARELEEANARLAPCDKDLPVVCVVTGDDEARMRFSVLLQAHPGFAARRPSCLTRDDGEISDKICSLLPHATKLEFARFTNAKKAQAEIAGTLLKSFSAVCGVVALQPIPLADMPILTALQSLMVAMIVHTSGRSVNTRLVAEFLGALGLNIGAGILFRESARALVKVVPVWGNAVSGFVAGAGTYAIGRAAIAYFIEETPLTETRKIFRRLSASRGKFRLGR